jgi:hypothetical protein
MLLADPEGGPPISLLFFLLSSLCYLLVAGRVVVGPPSRKWPTNILAAMIERYIT